MLTNLFVTGVLMQVDIVTVLVPTPLNALYGSPMNSPLVVNGHGLVATFSRQPQSGSGAGSVVHALHDLQLTV